MFKLYLQQFIRCVFNINAFLIEKIKSILIKFKENIIICFLYFSILNLETGL